MTYRDGSLMKAESIAECSPWSILQYFCPALSDNWSWKTIFGPFCVAAFDRFYCVWPHLQIKPLTVFCSKSGKLLQMSINVLLTWASVVFGPINGATNSSRNLQTSQAWSLSCKIHMHFFSWFFCRMLIFFLTLSSADLLTKSKFSEKKKTFRNSNRVDPDQTQHFVRPDLGPNCLQRLSADDTSRQRVSRY